MIPTAFDKTLCPEGTHIMSLFTQWVPDDWNEEPHTAELEAYADRMIDCYNELAPNFKASILHRDIVGPYEMEHEYGLIGGNIFHGELSLEQLFHMRPAPGYADYRTPLAGLYYGSSATHAGGGVCGIPGWQAARAAIADKKAAGGPAASAGSSGGHDHRLALNATPPPSDPAPPTLTPQRPGPGQRCLPRPTAQPPPGGATAPAACRAAAPRWPRRPTAQRPARRPPASGPRPRGRT